MRVTWTLRVESERLDASGQQLSHLVFLLQRQLIVRIYRFALSFVSIPPSVLNYASTNQSISLIHVNLVLAKKTLCGFLTYHNSPPPRAAASSRATRPARNNIVRIAGIAGIAGIVGIAGITRTGKFIETSGPAGIAGVAGLDRGGKTARTAKSHNRAPKSQNRGIFIPTPSRPPMAARCQALPSTHLLDTQQQSGTSNPGRPARAVSHPTLNLRKALETQTLNLTLTLP
eukprot:scaffold1147_cov125-Isochrysis_galbana.AAC.3